MPERTPSSKISTKRRLVQSFGICLLLFATLGGIGRYDAIIAVTSPMSYLLGPSLSPNCGPLNPTLAVCPTGTVDYGIPSYFSIGFRSWVNFTKDGIVVTNPGSNKPGDFSVQQNLVLVQAWTGGAVPPPIPHGGGFYWIQNVAQVVAVVKGGHVERYKITQVDNIWNFSNTNFDLTSPGAVVGNQAGLCTSSGTGTFTINNHLSTFYFCRGTTVQVSRPSKFASLPSFQLLLYTRTGVDAMGRVEVTLCQSTYVDGTLATPPADACFDDVRFAASYPAGATLPSCPPTCALFQVNNATTAPSGSRLDMETILGGLNARTATASISSINARLAMFNQTSIFFPVFASIQHAWSEGADTAEGTLNMNMTATGMVGIAAKGTQSQVQLW